jgi:type I restriction enzyme M protein
MTTPGSLESRNGVPPQQYGDFAFLLHCVKSMKSDGKCAIILPPMAYWTRVVMRRELRKWLIEQRCSLASSPFPPMRSMALPLPGNVLILDNHRVQDGRVLHRCSELGYKDADSRYVLREQTSNERFDVWRHAKNEPHFAHPVYLRTTQQDGEDAPMYEIQRNAFNLNMSRYVVPKDKEIHQNLDGHLHGGIRSLTLTACKKYWDICPSLRTALVRGRFREGFFSLAVENRALLRPSQREELQDAEGCVR